MEHQVHYVLKAQILESLLLKDVYRWMSNQSFTDYHLAVLLGGHFQAFAIKPWWSDCYQVWSWWNHHAMEPDIVVQLFNENKLEVWFKTQQREEKCVHFCLSKPICS